LTEGSDPEEPSPSAPDPAPDGSPPASSPHRYLGLTTFTVEGRQAPALFVIGWLATLAGVGLTATVAFGVAGLAGAVLSLLSMFALSVGLIMLAGSQTIERRAAGAAYTGPSPLLVLIAIVAVSRVVGFLVGVALLPIASRIPVEIGDLLAVVLQAVVFFAVLRLTIIGPGVLRWSEMGWVADRAAAWAGIARGAVFAGPLILLTSLIVAVAVFRGFALSSWRRLVGVRAAIVRSSIVFVLAHVLFVSGDTFAETVRIALVAGVVRIPVAFALGWLFVRTGSIWGPIGLHATFNGILIVVAEAAARA
jgi:membrane protease YdiL (CAAX protease family)